MTKHNIAYFVQIFTILKFIVPPLLIVFLLWNIARDWQTIVFLLQRANLFFLSVAFVLLVTVYPEGAFSWHIMLRMMGIKVPLKESFKVWIIATASRYIPGSVWQYLGRIELAHTILGLSRNSTIMTLLFEIFLGVGASIVVASFALPYIFHGQVTARLWIFLLPFPLIFFHPFFSEKVMAVIARVVHKPFRYDHTLPGVGTTMEIFPWYVLNFLINGLALSMLVYGFYGKDPLYFFQLSGIYALSWVIGYVALFAPAGIGVTETSLAYFLSFVMPFGVASLVALTHRLLLTLAELFVFIVAIQIRGTEKWQKL